MNTERMAELQRQMLRILIDAGDYMVPEPRLREIAERSIMPYATCGELDEALRELDMARLAQSVQPRLGPRKWAISDLGRVEYRS